MTTGFCIRWTTRNGRPQHSFSDVSYSVVDSKHTELKAKGYKVSNIMQCYIMEGKNNVE